MKVFSPFLNGNTTTSGSFNVPNHPGTGSIQNPLTGSLFHDDTDGILKVYTGTQWAVVGEQTEPASGPTAVDIEYLVVAGGGGGGGGTSGGGGAGGYLSSSLASVISGSSFTITVGAGAASTGVVTTGVVGNDGDDSSIAGTTITAITATGGGGGGDRDTSAPGNPGGSGGGGGGQDNNAAANAGGSGTNGLGNDGGDGRGGGASSAGGGGGGVGAAGIDSPSNGLGGNGGNGLPSFITGTSITRAGGGGGGSHSGQSSGGTGGGGAGATVSSTNSVAGTANTGGGGGGAGGGSPRLGAAGGSGVAIFAYDSGSANAAGGIVGDAGNGRKYHQFNQSGNFKVGLTSDFGIVTGGLLAHYDAGNYDSRGTSTWTDLSDSGNNGTVSGASLGNNFYYDFNGSSNYIDTPITNRTTTTSFCIWFNADTLHNCQILSSARTNATSYAEFPFSIALGSPGTVGANFSQGNNYSINASVTSTYTATTWTHIAVVYQASTSVAIYKNGILADSTSIAFSVSQNNRVYRIGSSHYYNSSQYFDGKVGQVQIYSNALSAAEVLQNYNATKTNFT